MMTVATTTPSRHRLGGFPGFALVSLILIGSGAFGLSLLFKGEGDLLAIWLSAAIARTTQLAAFPAIRRKVGRGRIEIDSRIDLHGMTQTEARSALHHFIHARFGRGDRTVLVITGKGVKTDNDYIAAMTERGVLRTMLPIWLNEPGLAPMVSGWSVAARGHGGEGAWYVRLRRA